VSGSSGGEYPMSKAEVDDEVSINSVNANLSGYLFIAKENAYLDLHTGEYITT
jgi:hypothetical protein